jgi:hypothetical protein
MKTDALRGIVQAHTISVDDLSINAAPFSSIFQAQVINDEPFSSIVQAQIINAQPPNINAES